MEDYLTIKIKKQDFIDFIEVIKDKHKAQDNLDASLRALDSSNMFFSADCGLEDQAVTLLDNGIQAVTGIPQLLALFIYDWGFNDLEQKLILDEEEVSFSTAEDVYKVLKDSEKAYNDNLRYEVDVFKMQIHKYEKYGETIKESTIDE